MLIQDGVAILKLNNPDAVTGVIPTARPFHMDGLNGSKLVLVPHRDDESMVLNRLGFATPAPILSRYKWPGRFKPMDHQRETAGFLTTHRKGLVLSDIGTGKTLSALWAADWLMATKAIRKCLVISPLSTLERVWSDEIYKNFPNRKGVVVRGPAAKRKKLFESEADFFIVNHDGWTHTMDAVDLPEVDLVIVDEAAVYRNPSTQRTRALRHWMTRHPETRLWLLTGTPTPNAPTDAWVLAKLMDNPKVDRTFTAFKNRVMVRMTTFKWVPAADSLVTLEKVLKPCVRYTRDSLADLPPTTVQTRHVDMSPNQKKLYNDMMQKTIVELGGGDRITAVNEMSKATKLLQISCGAVYTGDGKVFETEAKKRLQLVQDLVDEAGGKVLVFTGYKSTIDLITKKIGKVGHAAVHGGVSDKKRADIFHRFQDPNDPLRVIVAHPATMAHGLTLTQASTIVWYCPIWCNETYTQACGRVERTGKIHPTTVVHIESTKLEREIFYRLSVKQGLQGTLLDTIINN